ncbi:hypothetical protein AMATHDRAFT_139820 [Amanita thiersii Skay4041]|uniref:Nucleoside transporter n=1 Tax=Amanita thiersii Skay4041 TaxID=703135 RepID=A0A2A9NPW7_9AGAR|nr:hypothetical protein AMATHDRAFT_139820 [Amanita thiersii Skay4041]
MPTLSEALYQPIPSDPTQEDASSSELPGLDYDTTPPEPPVLGAWYKWTFFIIGSALLLPWNVIITAVPFFLSRLEGSGHLHLTFSSYLTTLTTVVNFMFLAHATFYAKPTSPARQTRKMILALSALTFMLIFLTFIRLSPGTFAFLVLLNAGAQAMCCAYLQMSVIAVGSLFGPDALQPISSGQAAVAVAVSGVQVFSAAASLWGIPREAIATYVSDGTAEAKSAFIFFAFSTVFLVVCAAVHRWLVATPVYQRIARPLEQFDSTNPEESSGLVAHETKKMRVTSRIGAIVKANMIYEIAVSYVFIVTLSVFPPITASILPLNPAIHPLLFSSIHFLVFNIGDFLGRYICSFPRLRIWCAHRLLILSLFRTLFIPLFLMCNVQKPSSSINTSPLINSDSLYMLILLAFGISNGYVSLMCLMSAPSIEHNPRLKGRTEDIDTVATVTNFSLVGGLFVGSAASFGMKAAICGCNPFTG